VTDFPTEGAMPLELPPDQAAAFDAHVRPLLDMAEAAVPYVPADELLAALAGLGAALHERPGSYDAIRGAADYVQCTFAQARLRRFGGPCSGAGRGWQTGAPRGGAAVVRRPSAVAQQQAGAPRRTDPRPPARAAPPPPPLSRRRTRAQCVVDAAASWALDADRASYLAALRAASPAAADEALLLELRRRLVAAGAGDLTAPLAASLRKARAPPAAAAGVGGPAVVPFRDVAAAARGEGFELGGGAVAWPALRRSLAAASGRYLEPVLGEVAQGGARIVVSGGLRAAGRRAGALLPPGQTSWGQSRVLGGACPAGRAGAGGPVVQPRRRRPPRATRTPARRRRRALLCASGRQAPARPGGRRLGRRPAAAGARRRRRGRAGALVRPLHRRPRQLGRRGPGGGGLRAGAAEQARRGAARGGGGGGTAFQGGAAGEGDARRPRGCGDQG
jgi:hypothetical protein